MDYIKLLATFFYTGLAPKAPGTVGTLAAIPLVLVASLMGSVPYVIITVVLVLAAIFVAQLYERSVGSHDNSEIVIDEVVGFMMAMALVPITWVSLLVGFVLFRIIDIFKPFPISYLDRNIKGGLGVVIDDLAAGVVVNILLQVGHQKYALF